MPAAELRPRYTDGEQNRKGYNLRRTSCLVKGKKVRMVMIIKIQEYFVSLCFLDIEVFLFFFYKVKVCSNPALADGG